MQPIESRNQGFTLIELLIVVAIVGVLAGLAVPSFATLLAQNRLASQANEFVAMLNLARNEAIRRAASMRVTSKSGDQVFSSLGFKLAPSSSSTSIVRETSAFYGNTKLSRVTSAAGNPDDTSSTNISYIEFNARGANLAGVSVLYKVCDTGNTSVQGRLITITAVGRIATTATTC